MAAKQDHAGIILMLAKKEAAKRNPKAMRDEDYRACAKGLLAAIKSGDEEEVAKALEALHEVGRAE